MRNAVCILLLQFISTESDAQLGDSIVYEIVAITDSTSFYQGISKYRLYRELHYYHQNPNLSYNIPFATSSYMLQQSVDSEKTWIPVIEFNEQNIVNDLKVDNGGFKNIFRHATPFLRFFDDLHGLLFLDLSTSYFTGAIYYTSDGGKSWQKSKDMAAAFPFQFWSEQGFIPIRCSNDSTAIMFIGTHWETYPLQDSKDFSNWLNIDILITHNKGITWEPGTAIRLPAGFGNYRYKSDSDHNIKFEVEQSDYVSSSTDGGIHWQSSGTSPLENRLIGSYFHQKHYTWSDSIVIYPNHRVKFFVMNRSLTPKRVIQKGKWKMENNQLHILVKYRLFRRKETIYTISTRKGIINLQNYGENCIPQFPRITANG